MGGGPAWTHRCSTLKQTRKHVNDTYTTDEPAVEAAAAADDDDQYLTVDNTSFGAGDAGTKGEAEDEYLSVAAGLGGGDNDSDDDFEC